MALQLVTNLDSPGAIVRHDDQQGHFVACRSVNLHCIKAKGAVTSRDNNSAPRASERSCDTERGADPNAAQRAGVEYRGCQEANAREAQEVATVSDHHRVCRYRCPQGGQQAVRMHQPIAAGFGSGH